MLSYEKRAPGSHVADAFSNKPSQNAYFYMGFNERLGQILEGSN